MISGAYTSKVLTRALYRFAISVGRKPLLQCLGLKTEDALTLSFSDQNSRLHDVNQEKLKFLALTCDPYPAIVHQYK